jgi:hypothetical protein
METKGVFIMRSFILKQLSIIGLLSPFCMDFPLEAQHSDPPSNLNQNRFHQDFYLDDIDELLVLDVDDQDAEDLENDILNNPDAPIQNR